MGRELWDIERKYCAVKLINITKEVKESNSFYLQMN